MAIWIIQCLTESIFGHPVLASSVSWLFRLLMEKCRDLAMRGAELLREHGVLDASGRYARDSRRENRIEARRLGSVRS